jgi:5-methylcytosine-specific restriction endonuclease McrA
VDCGWEPEIVTDCRRFELGDPPFEKVLDELRQRLNRGERHLHADHQIPITVRPDLRLELDNLRTRCDRCHNRKTRLETAAG